MYVYTYLFRYTCIVYKPTYYLSRYKRFQDWRRKVWCTRDGGS